MSRSRWLAFGAALLMTLGSAVYQRRTGPTWPKPIELNTAEGIRVTAMLPRSGTSEMNTPIMILWEPSASVTAPATSNVPILLFRKYRFETEWSQLPFTRIDATLWEADLPKLPPAGKMEYAVGTAFLDGKIRSLFPESVVLRYKGAVDSWILVPHVIVIFAGMLLANFTGLLALLSGTSRRTLVNGALASLLTLFLGGMIFGAMVQKQAFGEYWTGFPFGWDLTDNKTLIAFSFWCVAFFDLRRSGRKHLVVVASLVTLLVFLVPHSVAGSELDFATMNLKK